MALQDLMDPLSILDPDVVLDGAKTKPAPKPRGYAEDYFTDTYLGESLAEELKERALYLPEEKTWLIYNPAGYWEQDRTERVAVQAKEWVKKLNHEVKRNGNGAEQVNASKYLARRNRENLVKEAGLAKSVVSTSFDSHNDYLLVANGKVDLRTSALDDVQPSDRFQKHSSVAYKPDAGFDLWLNVLRAFPSDTHDYLQIIVGQALTGYMPSDGKVFFFHGGGKNGKSTFLDCLKVIAGTVANKVDNSLLLHSKGNGASPEKMALNGLRLGFLEELPEDNFLNAKMLKEVAGTPEITARPLFGNYITFVNRATLFITTNFLPKVSETDHGTWRRLLAIPTPFRFIKRSAVPDDYVLADNELWQEESLVRPTENMALLEQGLAWAIEGARKWYADGRRDPEPPPSVVQETTNWLGREDKVASWLEESLVADEGYFILSMDAYDSYREFTLGRGQKVESYQGFLDKFAASSLVRTLGLEARRTTKGECQHSTYLSPRQKDGEPRKAGRQVSLIKGVRFALSTDQGEPTEDELAAKRAADAIRAKNQDALLNDNDLLDEPIY